MILNINYFGLVAEATQCFQEQLEVPAACTLLDLKEHLYQVHPSLTSKPFRIAVNQAFVGEGHLLHATDEVALLPPFAGG